MIKIEFNPTPKQWEAFQALESAEVREVLFGGGAGSAKSYLGCAWLIISSIKYPGSKWAMCRSELKTLKQTTLASFFDLCRSWNIERGKDFVFNENKGEIHWQNGSIIILKDVKFMPSDPEFDSLGSLEITGAFIDEVAEVTQKAKDILHTRCRYKLTEFSLKPTVLMSCNPCKGWPYIQFYKASIDKNMKPGKLFIQALASDNPHLDPSYIETLESKDEATKQRLLYGNWDFDDNPQIIMPYQNVVKAFTRQKQTNNQVRYLSCDIALEGADKMVIVVWIANHIEKVYTFPKTNGAEVIEKIKSVAFEWSVNNANIVFDGTGVGGFVAGYLPGAKDFRGAGSPIGKQSYSNLRSQTFFRLAELLNTGKISIGDKTYREEISQELGAITSVPAAMKATISSKDKIIRTVGHSPDFADAISMKMVFNITPPASGRSLSWI